VPRDTTVRRRVIEFLVANGPVYDESGRATSRLKDAVGYAGGDAGFIRVVSLMADAGEIVREVRGKRTYRISVSAEALDSVQVTAPATPGGLQPKAATSPEPVSLPRGKDTGGELDYDELAAALLARVARTLSLAETASEGGDAAAWARRRIDQLEAKVVALQRDLARARAEVQAVADER